MKKVELLAPAGDEESFYAAINAGADAVYLGGEKYSARAYADNFSTQKLISCIRYAHIWGKKVYLTVNTLVKDRELSQLYEYILPLYEAGLDAAIIQDFGVFLFLKRNFPKLKLHVSTQMTITGVRSSSYMRDLGACRIIPARELSLEEIRLIKQKNDIEIEVFVHGAMCYCYSGQCLFSSLLGDRSGNRGRCAQPCRLAYEVDGDGRQVYPLSMKDLCTIDDLPDLIEAGVDSFKIEGRMKKPEYVAGVTAAYRRAIDRYYSHSQSDSTGSDGESDALSHLYVRGELQNGYLFRHNGADMVSLEDPAYAPSDEAMLGQIRNDYVVPRRRLSVDIYARFCIGEKASLTMICGSACSSVDGEEVETAVGSAISEANVKKQLGKLGGSVFCADCIMVELDEGAFYSLRGINELRRMCVSRLEDLLITQHNLCSARKAGAFALQAEEIKQFEVISDDCAQAAFRVSVLSSDQLFALSQFISDHPSYSVSRVYMDGDLVIGADPNEICGMVRNLNERTEVFLSLPQIIRDRDEAYLRKIWEFLGKKELFRGCMVRSLEGYAWLCEMRYDGAITSDAGFYIWNREALKYWGKRLESFCLPVELTYSEQKSLLKERPKAAAEKIVYGYLPMMVSANCVRASTGRCSGRMNMKVSGSDLKDRRGHHLPVRVNCIHCLNIIYNSVPLSLHGSLDEWGDVCKRLDFTVENRKSTYEVLAYFYEAAYDPVKRDKAMPFSDYTTGHEKRSVE